jgi:hypothetical protein
MAYGIRYRHIILDDASGNWRRQKYLILYKALVSKVRCRDIILDAMAK